MTMNQMIEIDNDGKIIDYVSGISVPDTPEERHAVQIMCHELIQSLGYEKSQIVTRPQFRVASRPSDADNDNKIKSHGYPLDIAIFDDVKNPKKVELASLTKNPDDLRIIIECKAPNRKDGLKQLKTYLDLSAAEIGVWFNGSDKVILRKVFDKAGKPSYSEIPTIPRKGQSLADIGKHKKADLERAHNLKTILVRIRNHLAGNATGTTRDEAIATEIINLLFCKIHDEKVKKDTDIVEFRAQLDEPAKNVATRVKTLFDSMKLAYKGVFSDSDKITLEPAALLYVVGELQQFGLLKTERDIVADAFEVFIGPSLKGAQGQFFTPRNAVSLAINLLNINEHELVIDPACGSGGFLVETLARKWAIVEEKRKLFNWDDQTYYDERNKTASHTIFGIEKDAFLAKVAKAYMAIMGDGKGGIYCENTLANLSSWKPAARNHIWGDDSDDSIDTLIGKFDVVVANPPYGEDIRITDPKDLAQYKIVSSKASASKKGIRPDILFIERSLQLLKSKGRMAIVLIETFFHAPDSKPVLDLMKNGNNITHVIDLPHNTFRPHCNAKTVIIVLEKDTPQCANIQFAVAQQMGHDHRGEPMYRRIDGKKTSVIWDDLAEITEDINIERLNVKLKNAPNADMHKEIKNALAAAKSRKTTNHSFLFSVPEKTVNSSGVYVPRFHWADAEKEIREEATKSIGTSNEFGLLSIQDLLNDGTIISFDGHGSPDSFHKGTGEMPYIRVDDISSWSIYKNPVSGIPMSLYQDMVEEPYRKACLAWQKAKKDMEAGKKSTRKTQLQEPIDKRPQSKDILFVRRGSYRIGSVAIISPYEGNMVLTREILTFRVNVNNKHGLTPEYLLFALSHPLVQRQMPNKVLIDTTLPNIGDRWKTLLLPLFNNASRSLIDTQLKDALQKKWDSEKLLAAMSLQHGRLTM